MSYEAAVAFSVIFAVFSLVEGIFIAVLLIRIIKGIKVEQEICALWLLVRNLIKSFFERGSRERVRGVRSTSRAEEGITNEPISTSTDARYSNFSDHQKSSNASNAAPPPPAGAEGMNEAIQSLATVMKAKEAPMCQSVMSTPDCRRSSSTKASSQRIAKGPSKSIDNSLTVAPPQATTQRQRQQENPPTVIFTGYSKVDVAPKPPHKPHPIVTPYEVPVATMAKPLSDDVVLASYDKVTDSHSVPPVYTEPKVRSKSRFK
uniref:Uncharacterized protein n=1 Tax=Amphimedon queenslandica TaxID=400682 RepID=A0A1X7VRZ1_AMPQE